ncbi:MAG: hypothetical protein ACKOOC_03760 [Cyanobium sp.]
MTEVLNRVSHAAMAMEGFHAGEQGRADQQGRKALAQAPIRQVGRQLLTDQRPQRTTDQQGL